MEIKINAQSSIKIVSDKIIYFDPFLIDDELHDADIIFITHDHHDHFSLVDIKKVENENTIFVIPDCMYNLLGGENIIVVKPNEKVIVEDYEVVVISSYNKNKSFHPKEKGYVSYIVEIENEKIFVAGDCDRNEDIEKIKCDIALVPIGGHYTMDYKEAADLINLIKPKIVIPTHYGAMVGDKEDGLRFKELIDKDIEVSLKLYEEENKAN